MKDIKEIRRENMLYLVKEIGQGKLKNFGEITKIDPSYLSQVKNQTKGLGDTVARKIEEALDLGFGWMDSQHGYKKRRQKVNEIEMVLSMYHKTIPVDIDLIAHDLGLIVRQIIDLDNDVSGYIKFENDKYIIGVNANHHPHRRRFTIAHEIAHYLLHKEKINSKGIVETGLYRSDRVDIDEREANYLAAQILMPEAHIARFWSEDNKESIKEFADKFQVSEIAMAIRLGIPI